METAASLPRPSLARTLAFRIGVGSASILALALASAPPRLGPAVQLAAEAGDRLGVAHYCRGAEVVRAQAEAERALTTQAGSDQEAERVIGQLRNAMVDSYVTARMRHPDCGAVPAQLLELRTTLMAPVASPLY